MIEFLRRPFIIQNYPIVNWSGVVPERWEQLHVRVELDLLHNKGDSKKINALMAAVSDLMEDATFRDTGNKVIPSKLAQLVTQDGREAVVPASSVPRGMFVGKEQENGQRQQPKRVQQGEGEGIREEVQPDVQERNAHVSPAEHIKISFSPSDDLRDEERGAGAETAEELLSSRDPPDA